MCITSPIATKFAQRLFYSFPIEILNFKFLPLHFKIIVISPFGCRKTANFAWKKTKGLSMQSVVEVPMAFLALQDNCFVKFFVFWSVS